ncbi:MAG: GrpB family protein [bacterium]
MQESLQQRIEKVIQEDISLVPYDVKWQRLFEKEADILRAKFPQPLIVRIEHFGSTAIPGLSAKPVVDMLVEVNSLEETQKQIVPALESEGYDYFWRTDVSPAYAWFIKRNSAGKRTHHIHLVEADSQLWERLFFRDYLREFPEEAKRYEKLKINLSERYPNDRVNYTKGKTAYVVAVTEKAKQYYHTPDA